jgi:hypothetical protein
MSTIKGTLAEVLGRANPIFKGAAELSTGKLLYGGGRDISTADKPLGRAFSNVSQALGFGETNTEYLGDTVEYLSSSAPYLSNAANIVRTATDPRKEYPARALNILTGAKLTDVSPQARDRVLSDRIHELVQERGGSIAQVPYLPDWKKELYGEERLRSIDELLDLSRQRQRERRRQRATAQ